MAVNHGAPTPLCWGFSVAVLLSSWWLSATVGPVGAGSMWVVCGTEVSVLAGTDHQGLPVTVMGVGCQLAHL